MKSNLHDIEVHLHWETNKAWLVSTDGDRNKAVWMPKSLAEFENHNQPAYNTGTLTAPEPLLIEKGLV